MLGGMVKDAVDMRGTRHGMEARKLGWGCGQTSSRVLWFVETMGCGRRRAVGRRGAGARPSGNTMEQAGKCGNGGARSPEMG